MANIKTEYAPSSNMTVSNLNSLSSSSTWIAGWESAIIDNTSAKNLDYLLSGKLTVAAAGLSAGQIRIYVIGMLDDSNWPDVFDGTESGETITDVEIRDGFAKLAAVIETDTGASDVYYFGPVSVAALFGGTCPHKFLVYITQSTGAALASSGNQITTKGVYASST